MSEFMTHAEWVKLVATMLEQMANHNLMWDTRFKVQKVMNGQIVVLDPGEMTPLGSV